MSELSLISSNLRNEVSRAAVLGMCQETRDAWSMLLRRLSEGPLTLLGAPGPNRVLLDRARQAGALEGALDDPSAPTHRVVIPFTGATPLQREKWRARGHELIDLTHPAIRRAHSTVKLLRTEGHRIVLVGHPGDAECLAIAGDERQVAVIDSADEAAALPFAPCSTVVFQTCISSQRAQTVLEALRQRYRDSQVDLLDTLSPATLRREQAMRRLARENDLVVIIADRADASGRALYEIARWCGCEARILSQAGELDPGELQHFRRIGISAGEFTPDELITEFEEQIARW